MKQTLVIYSHSYQDQSVSNKAIIEVYKATPGITVHNLEEMYPEGKIDVAAEQAALEAADVIVIQHPVFWFTVPPMLKRWMDDVWAYGFAYGSTGDKLQGKKLLHSITTGSPAEVYTSDLQAIVFGQMKVSAAFCGMEPLAPIATYGLLSLTNPNAADQALEHAHKVVATLQALA